MSLFNGDPSSLRVCTGVKISWRKERPGMNYDREVAELAEINRGVVVRFYQRPSMIRAPTGKNYYKPEGTIAVCDLDSFKHNVIAVRTIIELDTFPLSLEEMLTCELPLRQA